jgi:hypothetical protein
MYTAASAASIQHSILEHYDFTRTVKKDITEYLPELERGIDDIIEEEKAKKFEEAVQKGLERLEQEREEEPLDL